MKDFIRPAFLEEFDRWLLTHRPHLWATKAHYFLFWSVGVAHAALLFIAVLMPISVEYVPHGIGSFVGLLSFAAAGVLVYWLHRMYLIPPVARNFKESAQVALSFAVPPLSLASAIMLFWLVTNYRVANVVSAETLAQDLQAYNAVYSQQEGLKELYRVKSHRVKGRQENIGSRWVAVRQSDEWQDFENMARRYGFQPKYDSKSIEVVFDASSAPGDYSHYATRYRRPALVQDFYHSRMRSKFAKIANAQRFFYNPSYDFGALTYIESSDYRSKFFDALYFVFAALFSGTMALALGLSQGRTLPALVGAGIGLFGFMTIRSMNGEVLPLFVGVEIGTLLALAWGFWKSQRSFYYSVFTAGISLFGLVLASAVIEGFYSQYDPYSGMAELAQPLSALTWLPMFAASLALGVLGMYRLSRMRRLPSAA